MVGFLFSNLEQIWKHGESTELPLNYPEENKWGIPSRQMRASQSTKPVDKASRQALLAGATFVWVYVNHTESIHSRLALIPIVRRTLARPWNRVVQLVT